jgi:hypothetical protein
VPGIGHVMAARIIAARPLRSADDLKKVSGIGDKKYAQVRPVFSVKAPRQKIKLTSCGSVGCGRCWAGPSGPRSHFPVLYYVYHCPV